MFPEEKVARRFSEKRGLKPPIDVEVLLRETADLEEDWLPSGYDAVFLDRSAKYPRPRIILQTQQPATRRLFTLAHELGHIVIPWHNGTHFCRVDGDLQLVDHITREVEAQANRFAGELLMPAAWVNGLVRTETGLKNMVEAVKTAGVSHHAASIRLVSLLPKGFLFVEVDSHGNIVRGSSSPGTWIRLPEQGKRFVSSGIDGMSQETASFRSGASRIVWWRLKSKLQRPERIDRRETTSELLRRICTEVFTDEGDAKRAIMAVNGVIGSANNFRETDQDIFTLLKHRFLSKKGLSDVISHESFDEFLAIRAEELQARRARK